MSWKKNPLDSCHVNNFAFIYFRFWELHITSNYQSLSTYNFSMVPIDIDLTKLTGSGRNCSCWPAWPVSPVNTTQKLMNKTHPFSLRSASDDTRSLVMTFLPTSVSDDIRVCAVLHAAATASSEFPISWGPEESRLVSSGRICFPTEKTKGKKSSLSVSCALRT